MENPMTEVLVFTTSTCPWCRRAKECLAAKGLSFREVNVERDASAARTIQKQTGQTGVPVIKIGSKWIVGFDKPAIERELARKEPSTAGLWFLLGRQPPLMAPLISCAASTTKISTEAPRIMLDRSPLRYSRPTRRFRSHISVIARNGMNNAPREA